MSFSGVISLVLRVCAWVAAYVTIGALCFLVPIFMEFIIPGYQKFIPEDEIPKAVQDIIFVVGISIIVFISIFFLGAAFSTQKSQFGAWKACEYFFWKDISKFATIPVSLISAMLFIAGLIPDMIFSFAGFSALIVGATIFFPALWLKRYAARRSVLSADCVLAKDPRPPVLYLRAFKDDVTMRQRTIPDLVRPFLPGRVLSEEEQLARALNPIGPVIAIADPGAPIQNLGAAYNSYNDDEWQEAVQKYIEAAEIIVIRVSDTDFVYWEIEQAIKNSQIQHIWFLISDAGAAYEFARRFRRLTGIEIDFPENALENTSHTSIKIIISFNNSEEPVFTKVKLLPYWRNNLTSIGLNQYKEAFSQISDKISRPLADPLLVISVILLLSLPVILLLLKLR